MGQYEHLRQALANIEQTTHINPLLHLKSCVDHIEMQEMKYLQRRKREMLKKDDSSPSQESTKKKNLYEILAEFLVELGRFATGSFYHELCCFACVLLYTMNSRAGELYPEEKDDVLFNIGAEKVHECCDDLVDNLRKFHTTLRTDKERRLVYFGEDDFDITTAINFSALFQSWLFMKDYSHIILEPKQGDSDESDVESLPQKS
eukprot:TRINITY_DN7706_c0_g1_i5.p1 TRINITY_DN7706_c0_g1~~TRINITY_DN7706_c0_g1_i5.p1  ORF type:complete len:204 (-),score=36.76 TRINITY_DN7706_c0_g1_i5:99-710(-)